MRLRHRFSLQFHRAQPPVARRPGRGRLTRCGTPLCGTALCGTVYLLAVRRCLLAVPQTVAPRPACARQNCARHRRGRFRPRLNPFVGRGKATRFRSLGDSRPDRVQIDVHAARQHGPARGWSLLSRPVAAGWPGYSRSGDTRIIPNGRTLSGACALGSHPRMALG